MNSPDARKVLEDTILALDTDGSFSLKCEFVTGARTDRGTWSVADDTITLSFAETGKKEAHFERVASASDGTITFEMCAKR